MKYDRILFIISSLLIFTLSSCVTMAPPKSVPETGKTLFVGRIIYEGSGLKNRAVNMNGKFLKNIELTLDQPSGTLTIKSGDEGIFYFFGDTRNYYRIKSVFFKREDANGSWSSTGFDLRPNFLIKSTVDGVTNIGTFYWRKTEKGNRINKTGEHDEVMNIFKKLFPDNIWAKERWTNILPA